MKRLAVGTVLTKEELAAEIVRIRQTGLHVSYAENVDGAGSLSVPVFDGLSRLHGALFITGPVDSVEAGRFLKHKELVFGAARRLHLELSSALPHRPRRRAAPAA